MERHFQSASSVPSLESVPVEIVDREFGPLGGLELVMLQVVAFELVQETAGELKKVVQLVQDIEKALETLCIVEQGSTN